MSYYPIRYEYSDESSNSQHATATDPPLFRQQEQQSQQQFHNLLESCPAMPFPPLMSYHDHDVVLASSISNKNESQQQQQLMQFGPNTDAESGSHWQPRGAADEEEEGDLQQEQQNAKFRSIDKSKYTHQQLHFKIPQTNTSFDYVNANLLEENSPSPSMHKGFIIRQRQPFQSLDNSLRSVQQSPSHRQFHYKMEPPEEEIEMQKAGKEIHDQSPAHWKLDEYGDGQRQQCKSKQKVQLQRRSQRQTYNENSAMENELGDGRQVVIVGEEIEDMGGCDIDRQQPFPADDAEPEAKGLPQIAPNGYAKPAYSYSCLIGLSLKNSNTGELTVAEIYTFLCHHFPYFREAPSGWKNSVRHNLSLNKCFKKIEIDTPGSHGRKSCLWTMNPARRAKMDQELRKWRERDEARILVAMEHPEHLGSIERGTMGMPPGMKLRRLGMPLCQQSTRKQPQQQQSLNSSQERYEEEEDDGAQALPRHFHQHPKQLYEQQMVQQQQKQQHSTRNPAAGTFYAQAARKLENLLQRQKSSSIVPDAAEQIDPFTGLLLPATGDGGTKSGGGGKKRRTSDCASESSSGHSSRRQSRPSNEQQPIETEVNQMSKPPPAWHGDAGQQPFELSRVLHLERQRQALAAALLNQKLVNRAVCEGKEDAGSNPMAVQPHSTHQLNLIISHRPLHHTHQLTITTDQPISRAVGTSVGAALLPSPFTSTGLGLDSCEQSLEQNPLLLEH